MNNMQRVFYENGRVRSEGALLHGMPHGIHREWHPNGVLAKETPCKAGLIDGIVRQWDATGKLVATSELRNGTGHLRTLNIEQGVDGEISFVNGNLSGRQRAFCGEELLATTYWLKNKKVSKKRYLEACAVDPELPRYGHESEGRATKVL